MSIPAYTVTTVKKMSTTQLPAALQGLAQKAADILKANGASKAVVFGPALQAYNSGTEVNIAVAGLDDDHLLKASGRIFMDLKLELELCRLDDPASAFAKAGSTGIEIL